MPDARRTTNYLLPVVLTAIVVVCLVAGVLYIRSSLMRMTLEERSSQLEGMVTQIRANLDGGLQTHWNLVAGLNNAIQGARFDSTHDLCGAIASFEDIFCLDMYGSRVMLLDEQGTAYLSNGPVGIWNDVGHLIDDDDRHTFVSETDQIDGCFLVFSQELGSPATVATGENSVRFTHVVLLKDIRTVKQYYTTTTYGGTAATYIIRDNGTLAYFDAGADDPIGARNIFKALREADYVGGQSFEEVEDQLARNGIAAAGILLDGTEYCCCLTRLDGYNMTLMLLVPADCVATNTMDMMNSTVRAGIIFVSAIAGLILLAFVSFTMVRRSNALVLMEQQANQELNRLRLEAESANAAKSTFLNSMSHDIRTPMNAIIGFTAIAMKQSPPPAIKDCLEKISESSDHLLTLINDVLDISRIESGTVKYNPVPVDVCEIADSVTTIMDGYLANRNIVFEVRLDRPQERFMLADAVRIREVLVNILGNAVKFTDDGGTITFEAAYLPDDDGRHVKVRYRVADTGIGMSEDFLDHIFDEFSQEDRGARTKYRGTGLGMAITKRYVDLMGGTIDVQSTKGVGSTFTIELPLETTTACGPQDPDCAPGDVDLTGVKILLAEDNDLNAEIAIVQLEELGVRITRASDGEEAVALFEQSSPGTFDLVLMDIMMPKMNGYEATRAIRGLEGRPDARTVPIIAMTANAFAEDVQASLEAGMNGHLSKPMVMDEVVKAIALNVAR